MTNDTRTPPTRWPLERVLFVLAGTLVGVSALLGAFVSPWFLVATVVVGVNQLLYAAVGACPASILLKRTCRLQSAITRAPTTTRTGLTQV